MEQSMKLMRCLVNKWHSNYGIMIQVFLALKMMTSLEGGVSIEQNLFVCFVLSFLPNNSFHNSFCLVNFLVANLLITP